ncbi:exoribonuclease-2 [Nitrosomonas sp. PY1]|uniref:ribonuclease catalytic domain-containing protein n=1 Tax=Nitrosomonas sp. PY1 TaxID=1803906 RepID=UPI001FC7F6CE|nr:RNB domain-containing ribonuclease [Nitrosomonas sp. PY1]GKS68437.1 exoribonuclease-2 [Nitrosomonas sp. PY1]
MNVFYEEAGTFKVGAVLLDNNSSLQVEAIHGKRSKIKANSVLLQFETPSLSEFMHNAQKLADELDESFLWECSKQDAEFSNTDLATEYFGHTPTALESAATLLLLQSAPMYFYKKGPGRYKAAPPEALKAALASKEKKRQQAEQQAYYEKQLRCFTLPEEFQQKITSLLYKPDKNSIEWKALEVVSLETKLTILELLNKCGAIPSTHDYHFNQFIFEHYPDGTDFKNLHFQDVTNDFNHLPISDVTAFSIDDATTTEIDDAFSITQLPFGSLRIGIHIAAPALGIEPESPLDRLAATRLSTVYLPGNKITMLPDSTIHHFTLCENRLRPVVSLYLNVSDDFSIVSCESKLERIKVTANLRSNLLETQFNETALNKGEILHPFSTELILLWKFACKMETSRGKANENNDKIDYSFEIQNDRVSISERRRGSPIDKVVSELMIYINTEWGKLLSDAGITGIFRSQNNSKVRMSTSPAPHQGLGVSQYAWSSSPMRRYVDLINQRQIISLLRNETPFYNKENTNLSVTINDFETSYGIYNEFQRTMERYWCLRWLLQENMETINAQIIKENLVKFDHLPFITRIASLPEIMPGSYVKLKLSKIDLLERSLHAEFVQKINI